MFKISILLLGFYLLLFLKCLDSLSLSPFPKNKNRPQKQDFSSHFQGLFLAFILFLGTMPFAPCRIFGFALKYGDTTLHIYYTRFPPIIARPVLLFIHLNPLFSTTQLFNKLYPFLQQFLMFFRNFFILIRIFCI